MTNPPAPGETDGHPASRLDDIVHQRARLGILTVLKEADRADFTYLRDTLALSDGNLSRHLSVLGQAGHVEIRKTFDGRRPRTWVRATRQGRAALDAEIAALRDLIGRFDTRSRATSSGTPAGTAGKGA